MLTPDFVFDALGFGATSKHGVHSGMRPFKRVTVDSRTVEPGDLFVAIQGDAFDGHDFIPQAIEKGARGVLCRKNTLVDPRKDLCVFPVENTIQAYRKLAAAWRREFSLPVVVVAGSVGKTTTKELLAAVLRGRWPKVLSTRGSQNGFVGIPMTLLEIRPDHGAAVIEVGIDEIGAMDDHMHLIGANLAVLTTIAPEHLEKLLDLPTVAREEGIALSSVASTGGLAVVNLGDPWIRPHFNTLRTGKKIGYALSSTPIEGGLSGQLSADGARLKVEGMGAQPAEFTLPVKGKHNASNLLAAVAVAHALGLTPAEIEQGLTTFTGAEGRSELREIAGGTPVVCDYYNASPASMEAGFQLLCDVAVSRRSPVRHACLGDMLELGLSEEAYHRALADPLMHLGIEQVMLYGERMKWLHEELQTRGYKGELSHHATHEELGKTLLSSAHAGDAILIKGSRGMKMETVWKILQAGWKTGAP